MTTPPLVSVVLSVHNGAADLPGAIDTILTQTFSDFELIAIDNGSTDESAAVLDGLRDPRVRIVHQENMGLAAALNRGIALARGRYIARQDHDDWAKPTRLEKQLAFLEGHPEYAMVGTRAEIWVEDRETSRAHDHPTDNATLQFELLFDNPFVHSSMLVRKSAFDVVGYYTTDPARQPPEDYELWSRIARRYKVANLAERLTIYREVPKSMSRAGSSSVDKIVMISAENLAAAVGAETPGRDHWDIAALNHRVPGKLSANADIESICRTIRHAGDRILATSTESDLPARVTHRIENLRHVFKAYRPEPDPNGPTAIPPNAATASHETVHRALAGEAGSKSLSAVHDHAVDVVIPVRNGAPFLRECLDSVMGQTRAPRAVIVVDDGSTDATPQILAEYAAKWPKLMAIRSEPIGVSHARNLAIRACAAPYVAFLDSDDVWAPEKLERQMAVLSAAGQGLAFVYCAYRCMDVNGQALKDHHVIEPSLRGKVLADLLAGGNTISGSCSAVTARRDLLERVGGFDERFRFGEDWDLWLKLAEIAEIDYVPEPLVKIRVHDKSAQRSDVSQKEAPLLIQSLLVLDRWYGTQIFPPQLRGEYRRTAVHVAIMAAKRKPALQLLRQPVLFWKIRNNAGRFGHDLFSGPLDFFDQIFEPKLDLLWHSIIRSLFHSIRHPNKVSLFCRIRHQFKVLLYRSFFFFVRVLGKPLKSTIGLARYQSLKGIVYSGLRIKDRSMDNSGSALNLEAKDADELKVSRQQKTMRLLFCCESYYPSRGGVQEVMRQIAERLVLAGHDVTVATSRHPERKFNSHNGVTIQEFNVAGNAIDGMSGELARYREFAVKFGADAILIKAAQQWTFDALWPVLYQIKARKVFIPCGFSGLHEPAFADYFAKLPGVLRGFDHLIFYAEKYRDIDFARAHHLSNYSVLPNGASELEFGVQPDSAFRSRLGILSPNEFVFLTVGTPIVTKGHGAVVEAFAKLDTKGRPATLILNGDWPQPVEPASALIAALRRATRVFHRAFKVLRRRGWAGLREQAQSKIERTRQEHEIDEWITKARSQPHKQVLCTNLSRPDLVQAFMAADLFVFASIVEYSPLVLFEAAAAGTPFLTVPVGNAEEIARWTGGGMICPAAKDERGYTRVDSAVLAREMERCMAAPDMLNRMGAAGRESWCRNFTWQAIAPRYEAILSGESSGKMPV